MKRLLVIAILLLAAPCWGAGVHYTGLTSADSRCSFTSSYSWLWWEGKDFSSYAGDEWEVIVTDSSGYWVRGITGAVGSGEAFGSDIVVNGGFDSDTSDWSASSSASLNSVAGGQSGNCLELTASATGTRFATQAVSGSGDRLYRLSFYVKQGTESTYYGRLNPTNYSVFGNTGEATAEWVQHISYGVLHDSSESLQLQGVFVVIGHTLYYDTIELTPFTAPAATGVYVTWGTVPSAMDLNAITDIQIIPKATAQGVALSGVTLQ
jgi:hypothetical protein